MNRVLSFPPMAEYPDGCLVARNAYYTVQVDRLESWNAGKWRLTILQCAGDASSATTQRLQLERLFGSHEEADEYASMWAALQQAPVIHPAAITYLRLTFGSHGFDVSAYSDVEVSMALRDEATTKTQSCADLFAGAFQRLTGMAAQSGR